MDRLPEAEKNPPSENESASAPSNAVVPTSIWIASAVLVNPKPPLISM